MKIIIPMAGLGSRFTEKGINVPKPLIEVSGKYMIEWALKNIQGISYSELIFIILKEHEENFALGSKLLNLKIPKSKIFIINQVTEGQLQTIMTAKESLKTDEDLLISPTDTYVASNIKRAIQTKSSNCAGIISVIEKAGNQWSFAKTDANNKVIQVAEKQRISSLASTGIYYFSNCNRFLDFSSKIISSNKKTKGEFYVIPVYQEYIEEGYFISTTVADEMWDLGTPESALFFENNYHKN